MTDKTRNFTIEKSEIGFTGGLYTGKEPYRVAAKAARALFNQAATGKKGKKQEIRFTLRETTMDSNKKEYHYIGMKKSLSEPIVVKRGDVEIKIKHTYHVKSCAAM
jgi:hypothetical protein